MKMQLMSEDNTSTASSSEQDFHEISRLDNVPDNVSYLSKTPNERQNLSEIILKWGGRSIAKSKTTSLVSITMTI